MTPEQTALEQVSFEAALPNMNTATSGRSDQVHAELTALLEELAQVGLVAGEIDKIARQTNVYS